MAGYEVDPLIYRSNWTVFRQNPHTLFTNFLQCIDNYVFRGYESDTHSYRRHIRAVALTDATMMK